VRRQSVAVARQRIDQRGAMRVVMEQDDRARAADVAICREQRQSIDAPRGVITRSVRRVEDPRTPTKR